MSRTLALVQQSDEPRNQDNPNAARALLETKLFVPRARSGLVPRPRLTDAIRQGDAHKLTVVVAPAGFGKTTLLAGWLAETRPEKSVGWVSLDATENEPARFLAYVIRALQNVHPHAGVQAATHLHSTEAPAIEAVLTTLINEINAIDADFTLVLDDYHVIDAEPVHGALTFLLDHLPQRMRVVIASRADPPLPLPRLRARGELTELRAADLRFTPDEASAFLNQTMSLGLSAADTAALERRTEGWIAGLKLAALSMKGRGDVRAFVDAFSGDNRYIADYLVEEVLRREPEHVQRFLLRAAILDRLSGPLCDAVMGVAGSQAVLEDLERRNLFVVALDDRREWFRFHHLFAEVLQRLNGDAERARGCHSRASAWYEAQGSRAEAVRHALAGLDHERAADLLERTWPEKNRSYESAEWLARVKSLPETVTRERPLLSMGYAWGLINSGELEAAEPWLQHVERWVAASRGRAEDDRFRLIDRELSSARVYIAQSLGNAVGTLEHAQRVLAMAPEGDLTARATGTALVALALWGRGELEPAYAKFNEALDIMRAGGRDLDVIRGMFVPADIRVAQGRLREAALLYEGGLAAAAAHRGPAETDELHLGLSEVHREWNDLAGATEHLDTMARKAEHSAHKGNLLRWGAAMARVCEARGDLDGALECLSEAARHDRRDPVPRARSIPALRAHMHLRQGQIDDAVEWARKARVSVDDELSYLREFEHVTFARVLSARQSGADALRLLERLRAAAEAGGRVGSTIEIFVLHALAQQAAGNLRGAADSLTQAVALAEPEGFLRVFLDEGQPMRELLKHTVSRGLGGEYARRVLALFDVRVQPAAPSRGGLVQPLTERELEILRLIAAGMRNQDIADHLSISAATVKRHIANTYGKLGVAHRTEALVKAKELRLL